MNETKLVPTKTETWKPFNMLDELRTEFEQLWQKPWLPFRFRRYDADATPMFAPRVDVYEKDNELIVRADLPGMKKEDVHVAYENGDLILKGDRKEEKEIKEENYYRAECQYGSFYRRLPLNFELAPETVNAKFNDGVLEVKIPMPKEWKTTPTEIAIN